MKPKSTVLIIAGSDSSGGAGIQADIKTVTSLGCYAMTAITAVTAQNTTGVKSIVPIEPKEISKQIEFSAKDIKPLALKIGMLHSRQVIQAVIKSLNRIKIKKIVLDPVMVAKGGTKLINEKAIFYIKNKLMKKILITRKLIKDSEDKASKTFDPIFNSNDELYSQSKVIEMSKGCDGILLSCCKARFFCLSSINPSIIEFSSALDFRCSICPSRAM